MPIPPNTPPGFPPPDVDPDRGPADPNEDLVPTPGLPPELPGDPMSPNTTPGPM